jgi:predicted nucleic-acid-binding Zn-ribbon protein
MKHTHLCPKCGHHEVLFLPQIADRDDDLNVRPLVVHVVQYDWREDHEIGTLQAYVCRSCGYSELYTHDAKSIPFEKIPGAKLLVGTPAAK